MTSTVSAPQPLRCAIYTRKSTEEGLNQPFNSLEAQREAAEAYILSQRHAGWSMMPEHYDDGGFTGGNLDRPALKQLLADIQAGRVDCVLVYKVDRLSRSLLDFARLMEIFERHGASLVSVTQPLNTTVSLGRLTLNILLSFAQFERELVVERTRDKMGAARRKGKWMGGIPVLGYRVAPGGGKLVINEEEAQRVCAIFELYLECRTVDQLRVAIEGRKWTNRIWTTQGPNGVRPFTRECLLRLLSNVVYIGQVRHQGETYPGEHTAIIEESVWRKAQKLLSTEHSQRLSQQRRSPRAITEPSPTTQEQSQVRVPRIARLMALALRFEQMIDESVVPDYTALAALGHVSRARVTQIMNLRNLAPDIQEELLFLSATAVARCRISESSVRRLSSVLLWRQQRAHWEVLKSGDRRSEAK
jgi:DNA invertase Pin-like site-specific DNA recombinase